MADSFRDHEIGESYETGDALRNATQQAEERGFYDFVIFDADAHHYDAQAWVEISDYLENPVIRYRAKGGEYGLPVSLLGNAVVVDNLDQSMSGRLLRYPLRRYERKEMPAGAGKELSWIRRAMDAMAVDYQIMFPTNVLGLSTQPSLELEVAISRAYARWMTERILPEDERIKTLLYLPLNEPAAALRLIEELAIQPGVLGYMTTGCRTRDLHHNDLVPVYKAIEERGLTLAFHGGVEPADINLDILDRFSGAPRATVPDLQATYLANWMVNGMPERFPGLKVIWIEGGLAWIPFMMQRLDHEFVMRSSEAPLLETLAERVHARDVLHLATDRADRSRAPRKTFRMINAETHCCSRPTIRTGTSTCRARSTTCRSSTSKRSETSSARTRAPLRRTDRDGQGTGPWPNPPSSSPNSAAAAVRGSNENMNGLLHALRTGSALGPSPDRNASPALPQRPPFTLDGQVESVATMAGFPTSALGPTQTIEPKSRTAASAARQMGANASVEVRLFCGRPGVAMPVEIRAGEKWPDYPRERSR